MADLYRWLGGLPSGYNDSSFITTPPAPPAFTAYTHRMLGGLITGYNDASFATNESGRLIRETMSGVLNGAVTPFDQIYLRLVAAGTLSGVAAAAVTATELGPPLYVGPSPDLFLQTAVAFTASYAAAFVSVDTLTYSLGGPWPAWATINPTTGVVSGTPTGAGYVPGCVVIATDSQNRSTSSAEFALLISGASAGGGGGQYTLLTAVNRVLVRLREETVTTLDSSPYARLVASFMSDIHREITEAHDWGMFDHGTLVVLRPGQTEYQLYEGSTDVFPGYPAPNAKSFVKMQYDSTPVAALYQTIDDALASMRAAGIALADPETVRMFRLYSNGVTNAPDSFAIQQHETLDGLRLQLDVAPDKDYFLFVRFHTPEVEIDPTGMDTQSLRVPIQPLVLGTLYLALNERGEELGEAGNVAEERYRIALTAAIETDILKSSHTNIFDMYRD